MAYRDKRYTIPALSVDLYETVYPTELWTMSQFIISKYEGGLRPGESFSGAFTFEGNTSFGLFTGTIKRYDVARKMLGVEFTWLSRDGVKLLEYMNVFRNPEKGTQTKTLRVTMTHASVNWSFSGMLVGQWYREIPSGERIRGVIRIEKAPESGLFEASVVRPLLDKQQLAVRFEILPDATFALLEAAIKKASYA